MTGIGLTLNLARQALSAQQCALNVTGQNVANVNTPGYSRQIVSLASNESISYGNYLLGSGVNVSQVKSACDQLLEERLCDKNSELSAYEEMASCLTSMENIFSMDSESGLSALLSEFWNSWQNLSNNPSGASERLLVVEAGQTLAEAFNAAAESFLHLTDDINTSLAAAVADVNDITGQLAELNRQIIAAEADGVSCANDLRDERNVLIGNLADLVNVDVFEQTNGSFTVTTGNGAVLVSGVSAKTLEFSEGRILWNGSGRNVDITDDITTGKVGGWLSIRDETIPQAEANINSLAKALVWAVNSQHAKGCGQSYCSSAVTGTEATEDSGLISSLSYADGIDTIQDFSFWIQNSATDPPTCQNVLVDLDAAAHPAYTLSDFADDFNTAVSAAGGGVTASIINNRIVFTPDSSNYRFAFGGDDSTGDSGVAAALGINTFFTGDDALGLSVNALLSDTDLIAAGQIDPDTGDIASGDNTNALCINDLQFASLDITEWVFDEKGGTSSSIRSVDADDFYQTLVSSLAVKLQSVERRRESAEMIANELQTQRDEISAVSLDEEMINLTKYQAAYSAAAKLLTVSDELLDTLLSIR
ncbi:MAG: flagellar hook-associated protein FlgK [Pseudomonadota bacterium]